jgi:hypothetical protein
MQLGLVPAFFTKQTIAPRRDPRLAPGKHDLMQAATDLLQAANVPPALIMLPVRDCVSHRSIWRPMLHVDFLDVTCP